MPAQSQRSNGKTDAPFEASMDAMNMMYDTWRDWMTQASQEGFSMFQQGLASAQRFAPGMAGDFEERLASMPWAASIDADKLTQMSQQWMDSFGRFMAHSSDAIQANPTDPQAYKKIYEAWLNSCAEQMEQWMQTPEFAAQSGQRLEHMSQFQEQSGKMLEQYWATLHLPSTHDMKELYHKLYVIERKLDDLDKQLYQIVQSQKTSKSEAKTEAPAVKAPAKPAAKPTGKSKR